MTTKLSASDASKLTARRLTAADAEAVLDVARLCDIAEIGEPDTDLEDVLDWLRHPTARAFGIAGSDGLDAFAWVSWRAGNVAHHADVRVRPGADQSVGPGLLDLVRRSAHDIDQRRPVHAFVHTEDAVRRRWFVAAGGTSVRHFWRMVCRLDEASTAAPLPASVEVRPVQGVEADLRMVADVVLTAFEDHFGHVPGERPSLEEFVRRTHAESGFDIGLWWLALVDGAPAAALIGRQFADEGIGFVNTLGTLRAFRGRGLGRALLLTAFGEFRARGLTRSVLGVDASNPTGAVRLYESVGMHAEHTWEVWELPPITPQ